MHKIVIMALALAACANTAPMPAPDAGITGTSYRCTNAPDTGVLEVCFDGDAGTLEDQLGPFGPPDWTCAPAPSLSGSASCPFYCPAGATGTTGDGCDTRNGCWCPHA